MKIKTVNFWKGLKYINLILIMLCSVVGVGFVSGAEIYEVFVRFGDFWVLSVIVFFVLMFLLTYKIIYSQNKIQKSQKLYNLQKETIKNTFLSKIQIKSILLFVGVVLISGAMFSGLKTLLFELCDSNYGFWFVGCVFIIFFVLFVGIGGLQKMDYFVLVFLAFVCVIFCNSNGGKVFSGSAFVFGKTKSFFGSLFFGTLYVFMNILQIQPIVSEFDFKLSKKTAISLSLVFSSLMTAILVLFVLFFRSHIELAECSMPFLEFFKGQGSGLFYVFCLGLVFSLVSSLLSSLLGVKRFLRFKLSNFWASLFAVFMGLILSVFDFSFFVSFVYPLVGFINFIIFVFL